MMFSLKLCAKKRFQPFIKLILIIAVIGIYFIVLLRESLAAWELTKVKNTNLNSANDHFQVRVSYKRLFQRKNDLNRSLSGKTTLPPPSTTINPIYEYSEELNAAAEHDFSQRRQHLWESCAKLNFIDHYPPNAWEFFISPGHGLAWCNIFKAASSTWMYYFNILGGYDLHYLQITNASPLELARKRFPRPTKTELTEALSNSLSFLIVRDPFERLLSAYKNKLEGYRNKFYKFLGKQIVKDYRKGDKRKTSGPTFREFVTFLVNSYKNNQHFDEHWTPIYTFCTPCSINYTLIAKVETFRRDSEYIIRQAGLETLLLNKLPEKKMKMFSNQSINQTKKLIAKYFSQLDEDLLFELLEIYGPDFDLFGYNSTKYFEFVQTTKPKSTDPFKTKPSIAIKTQENHQQQQQQQQMNQKNKMTSIDSL